MNALKDKILRIFNTGSLEEKIPYVKSGRLSCAILWVYEENWGWNHRSWLELVSLF